jgi:RNA polymerase sigma-70 factor (ECF subfamily)
MELFWLILASLAEDKAGVLIQRLRSQDPQALADLYDLYGRVIYVIILRIVNHPGVAEDLVQEVFLRAWNRAATLNQDYASVGPWLLSIARNCALDYRKSPHFNQGSPIHAEDVGLPFVTIDNEILSAERLRALQGAFRTLTPNQRQVIELAYYEGMSQSEISERMQQPLGTVKSWTRSALQRLREEVDPSLIPHV